MAHSLALQWQLRFWGLFMQMWDVPRDWTLKDAATVPVAYMTAYYALLIRGGLQPHHKVLVHSGTGAVGMAAIRICHHRGCEVRLAQQPSQPEQAACRQPHIAKTSPKSCRTSKGAACCSGQLCIKTAAGKASQHETCGRSVHDPAWRAGLHNLRSAARRGTTCSRRSPSWTTPTSATPAPHPSRTSSRSRSSNHVPCLDVLTLTMCHHQGAGPQCAPTLPWQ